MINFLKYRKITAISSLALFVAFGATALYKYQTYGQIFSYSIDFTGGTQVLFKFDEAVSLVEVKNVISSQWQNPVVRDFGNNEVLVRVKEFESDARGLAERIKASLNEKFTESHITIMQSESVGPGIGEELRQKSIRAVLISLVLMLLYIAFRFWSFAFATGAVVALFHDAVVIIAIFLFLDREISLNFIAAILAVLGYSINDTIVIFSQIKEYKRTMRGISLDQIVTASLNHTLRRTLLTSFATGLPVILMLIIGGEALRDLSLALLAGIIFGTYSSIYIASPIMMLLQRKN